MESKSEPIHYTEEMHSFLKAFIPGHSRKEITEAFIKKFGVSMTVHQLKYYCKTHKVFTGRTGRFEKGHRPTNAPPKGTCPEWIAPYKFKKGHNGQITCKPGTERVTQGGYIEVKVDAKSTWRMKHVLVWEEAHGKVPDGYMVIFKDNNRFNCSLNNLMIVSKSVNAVMNKNGFCNYSGELKETAVKIAELKIAIADARRRTKNDE